MLRRLRSALLRPANAGRVVRLALIAVFLWLAAGHWHPHYGFTRLLQADPAVAARMIPALRDAPVYVHAAPGSYDGFFYAQIATDPSLRTPELHSAIDDLGYRARRILLGAVAWTAGGGEPIAVVRAYPWLNLLVWLALAGLLWRLFPVDDWRGTLAWSGLLFASGTLLSVRFALPDLPALLFTAAALMAFERRRPGTAAGWLALAGLARETALLAVGPFWPSRGLSRRAVWTNLGWAAAAMAPVALWLGYVRATVGSSGAGIANFAWPFTALAGKLRATLALWSTEPDHLLVLGTIGGLVALIVQLLYVILRPARDDPWWRTGAAYGLLLACLGPAVWGEDLPGAAVRVLLPLGLAFNVLACRRRAALPWFVLGNLGIIGGWAHLALVPPHPRELATGGSDRGSYVLHTDEHWFSVETRGAHHWAWTATGGTLTLETWPHTDQPVRLALSLSALSPRPVEIVVHGATVWRGEVTTAGQRIELPPLTPAQGRLVLVLRSPAPPQPEGAAPDARRLGFSVADVHVE